MAVPKRDTARMALAENKYMVRVRAGNDLVLFVSVRIQGVVGSALDCLVRIY